MADHLTDRVEEGQATGKPVRSGRKTASANTPPPDEAQTQAPDEPTVRGDDPEAVNVIVALNRVMRDVTRVGKDSYHDSPAAKFNFRGIDDVLKPVGPAFRRHGIVPCPVATEAAHRDVTTSGGKPARETTLTVTYRFYGPRGDYVDAEVPAESMDNGDKGTPKAMSVAFRIALLQVLALPTDEPDPDSYGYEREQPAADPAEVARNKLVAAFTEQGLDAQAVINAYYRRTGSDVRTHNDAGAIYAFTSELLADPEAVLALPVQEGVDTGQGVDTRLSEGDPTPDDVRE